MSLSNSQPLYPEGESGWIIIVVGLLTVSSIIPAAFIPQYYLSNPANGLQNLLTTTAAYAFNQSIIIGSLMINLAKKLVKYFWVLLILAAILQMVVVLNEFDHDMMQALDQGSTNIALPAYRRVGVPVSRFSQVSYNIGICWWDLQAMWRNILIRETVEVLVSCETQNWQLTVNATMSFIGNTLSIPILFAQADGKEPFAFEDALGSLAETLGSIEPALQCSCAELQFAYTLIFDTIENPNLHAGLDRAINSIIYHPLNITVGALEPAFGIGPPVYDCNSGSAAEQVECAKRRPPDWSGIRESVCEFGFYTGQFLEDTSNLLVDLFIDDTIFSGDLFSFHKIISSLVCIISHVAFDTLDLLSHIDLIFDSDVLYLRHTPFLQLMDQFNLLSDGIREFWLAFNDSFTDDIGCILGEMMRLILTVIDETGQFIIALFNMSFDSNSLLDYFINFNETRYSAPYEELKECTFNLAEQINGRTADVVKEFSNFVEGIAKIIIKGVRLLSQDPTIDDVNNFVLTTLPPITNDTAFHLHGIFVTIGNWFRQFDETDSCTYRDFDPPFIIILTNPSGHMICDIGNLVELVGQLLRSIWIITTDLLYKLYFNVVNSFTVSDITEFLNRFVGWVNADLNTIYINLLDSMGGLAGSLFGDIDCPCVSLSGCSTGGPGLETTSVRGTVKLLVMSYLDAIWGMTFNLVIVFVNLVSDIINAGPSYSTVEISNFLCQVLEAGVDILGRWFRIVKLFADFLDCLIGDVVGTHINLFTGTIYHIIFSPTNFDSIRNLICDIVTEALDFFNFIYEFLVGGFEYIGDLITNGSITVVNFVIDLINDAISSLNSSLGAVSGIVNSIVLAIRAVICFLNRFVSIFTCLQDLSDTTTYSFTIPGFDFPSLDIDFGELGSITIDVPSIPSVSISSPALPSISSITGAINCLSTNLAGLGSSCGSGCGSGPITSPICSTTVNIPNVPTIPHVPEVKRYQTLMNDNPFMTEGDQNYAMSAIPTYPKYSKRQETLPNLNDTRNGTIANDTLFEDVMKNYSMKVCDIYRRISENTSVAEDLRKLYAQEFINCVISAQMVFIFNWKTFYNETKEWIDPLALSSGFRFLAGSFNFASKLYWPINNNMLCIGKEFESLLKYNQTNSSLSRACLKWDDYYKANNLSSRWIYNVGKKFELIREDLRANWKTNGTYGFFSFFATIWNFFSGVSNKIFSPQAGTNHSLYDSFWNSYDAYNAGIGSMSAKRFYTRHVQPVLFHNSSILSKWDDPNVIGFNVTKRYLTVSENLSNFFSQKREKIARYLQPKTERARKNRRVLSNFAGVFGGMYKEYADYYGINSEANGMHDYNQYDRNMDMLLSLSSVDLNSLNSMETLYVQWLQATPLGRTKIKYAMRKQIDQVKSGMPVKRGSEILPAEDAICGIPLPGGETTCINCTLVKRALDELIDRTSECVSITLRNLDLLNDEFFEPFVQRISNPFALMDQQTDGLFGEWLRVVAQKNITDLTEKYEHDKAGLDVEFQSNQPEFSVIINPTQSVADYIDDNLIGPTLEKVLGVNISVRAIINNVKNFLQTISTTSANSIFFWLQFYASINPTMNCEKLAERGVGFGNLPLTAFLVLIFLFVTMAVAARISYTLLGLLVPLILFAPYIVISLNYGVSPLSAPALPFCLADDLYKIVKYFDVDCISWFKILPGITSDGCPAESSSSREFLDCSQEPYYFNNPWRIAYFLLDVISPDGLEFVKTNNHYLLQQLRSIEGMETMLHFDYKPGLPTDEYYSCMKLRLPNLYIFYLYLVLLGLLGASIGLSIALLLSFLGGVIYYMGLISVALAGGLSGAQTMGSGVSIRSLEDYVIRNISSAPSTSHATPSGHGLYFSAGEASSKNLFSVSDIKGSSVTSTRAHVRAFTNALFPIRTKQD